MKTSNESAPLRATQGGVPDEQWRKLHPASPIIHAWKAIVALLAIVTYQNFDTVADIANSGFVRHQALSLVVGVIVGSAFLILLAIALFSYFSWKFTSFAVVDEGVYYRAGIFVKTLKHARLDRIQAVDIHHPLLGRIFGLGKINIEVAGGGQSNVEFGFLKTQELDDVRAEILARAAGVYSSPPSASVQNTPQSDSAIESGDEAGSIAQAPSLEQAGSSVSRRPTVAPERVLYTVPVGRLVASLVTNIGMIIAILVVLAILVASVVLLIKVGIEGTAGIFSGFAGIVAAVGAIWSRFAGEFNFTAAVSPDGIRTRSGLLETRNQTIPPRRVHAVLVQQPWLWRRFGWYRVKITQAGYGGKTDSDKSQRSADVLLPVGTRADAELALWLVIRDLGVTDPVAFIEAALNGTREGQGFLPVPMRARLFDWFSYKRRAVALTDTCFVIRKGWLTWQTGFIPVERIQSLAIIQGPWEKKCQLVDVNASIVPGSAPELAGHIDEEAGVALLEELRVKSQLKRASEPAEHWMLRVTKGLDVRQEDQSIYASQDDPSCENSVTVGEDNSDCDRADVQLEADESSAASSIE